MALNPIKGRIIKPHLVLAYGPDGVGKSEFGASAPKPYFLAAENGTNELNVDRESVPTFAKFGELLHDLADSPYETAVVDTLDWMESVVNAEVLRTKKLSNGKTAESIEDYGYGKGYVHAMEFWEQVFPLMDMLLEKGKNVILLGHSLVKKFEDPATPQGYERYQVKLHSSPNCDVAAMFREYTDTVLFINYETATVEDDKRRAFGGNARFMYTERRPGFDAKNRFGLPFQIPYLRGQGWKAYTAAVAAARASGASVAGVTPESLLALAEQITKPERKANVLAAIKEAGLDPAKLATLHNRLLLTLSGGKDAAPNQGVAKLEAI